MSALKVCSGILPSLCCSLLDISAPPNLPDIFIFIPLAPTLIADKIDCFINFLKETLDFNCCAINSLTNFASNSGFLISKIFICISLFVIFFISSFILSTSIPFFPIIIPGFDVFIVSIILFNVLSIIIFEIPPFGILAYTYILIFSSSMSFSEYLFLFSNQLESHPFIYPNLNPIGLTF
tara:strand:+ start:96 stop:635 length:540 start_codon:yes stop_codon:yes gene_type:complete